MGSSRSCWTLYSGTSSDFTVRGTYGYGRTRIGTAFVSADFNINGAGVRAKPISFHATGPAANLIMEADRVYYSAAHPAGKKVAGNKHGIKTYKTVPIGTVRQWTPNGYYSYESTVLNAGVSLVWSWNTPDYPGNWYIYGKSIIMRGSDFDERGRRSYTFDPDGDRPMKSVGFGWCDDDGKCRPIDG